MKWFKRKAENAKPDSPTEATAPAAETAPSAAPSTPNTTATSSGTTIAVKASGAPAPSSTAPTQPPALGVARLDEYRQDGALVVRAVLPGLDPAKDVAVTVANGRVQIDVKHRDQDEVERNGYRVQEVRYGRLSRWVPLPEGVAAESITATYDDGVLEVRIPAPPTPEVTRIPITAS